MELHELTHADLPVFAAVRNRANPWSRDETPEEIRDRDLVSPQRRLAMVDGNEVIAVGSMGPATFSRDGDILVNLAVAEEYRRQGIGSRMYTELIKLAPDSARTIGGWVPTCSPGAVALARRQGFRELFGDAELALDLTTFDEGRWAGEIQQTAASGVTLTSLAELDLDQAASAVYELWVRIIGQKRGSSLFNPGTFDQWQRKVLHAVNNDLNGFTIACHEDRYVGISSLWHWPGGTVYTFLTGVLPEFRFPGNPVEIAMKLRNIRLLREQSVLSLRAVQARRNQVSTNERLGFVTRVVRMRVVKSVDAEQVTQ